MGTISAPTPLVSSHDTSHFNSGNTTLDEWLSRRALKNQDSGASKTFVITAEHSKVIGYYALASGSIERNFSAGNVSKQMPGPIPVIILARLAIHIDYQKKKLGAALLKDAIKRTLMIAKNVGIRGLLVHAISQEAKQFYLKYGFTESPIDPMTLMIPVKTLKKHL